MRQGKLVVLLLVLLIGLQCALWFFSGKKTFEGFVLQKSVSDLLEHLDSRVQPTEWPEYFYLCPELEEDIFPEAKDEIESRLSEFGIEMITAKDMPPDGIVSRHGAIISTICLEARWNTPLLGAVDIRDGYSQYYVASRPSSKRVYLFVMGNWFEIHEETFM